MKTKTLYRLIEDETPILPHIAAQKVVGDYYTKNKIEVNTEQENKQYEDLISYLVKKANDLYNINSYFKKKIREKGNKGRDNLYMFMSHWMEAKMLKLKNANRNEKNNLYNTIPAISCFVFGIDAS